MHNLFVGTDLEDISRIRSSIDENGQKFLNRIYTVKERKYCESKADPAMHFAGRFCAKEAIIKALRSSGINSSIDWKDIEIEADDDGKPQVNLNQELDGVCRVSISHTSTQAVAFALYILNP